MWEAESTPWISEWAPNNVVHKAITVQSGMPFTCNKNVNNRKVFFCPQLHICIPDPKISSNAAEYTICQDSFLSVLRLEQLCTMYFCSVLLCSNVKVVAFGKAVLGMVEALESLLGQHIVAGVASVPKRVMGKVQQRDALSNFPKKVK